MVEWCRALDIQFFFDPPSSSMVINQSSSSSYYYAKITSLRSACEQHSNTCYIADKHKLQRAWGCVSKPESPGTRPQLSAVVCHTGIHVGCKVVECRPLSTDINLYPHPIPNQNINPKFNHEQAASPGLGPPST